MMPITRLVSLASLAILLSLAMANSIAGNQEPDRNSAFVEQVFKHFNFDQTALAWAIGTTKARMISQQSPCMPNGSEQLNFVNTKLLQSAEFDKEIEAILREHNVIKSAKDWSASVALASLSATQRAELLAIPRNSMSERIVGQWLWHGYDDILSNGNFFVVGTTMWKSICSRYVQSR